MQVTWKMIYFFLKKKQKQEQEHPQQGAWNAVVMCVFACVCANCAEEKPSVLYSNGFCKMLITFYVDKY